MDVRCPYLVGREPELAQLRAHLAAARAQPGRGAAVFVSGEPGVGKSRLVRELVALARADRVPVLVGRAVPAAGEVAFRPLAEVMAQALRGREPPGGPELAPWLPALRVMLPPLGAGATGAGASGDGASGDGASGNGPAGAAEASAHACGEALVRLLRWIRRRSGSQASPKGVDQPLLVVLEDLHWADPDTLGVLEYLADNLAGEPVLCLATLRSEPPTAAMDLARRTDQRGTATHLPLGRLGDDAVAEMVRATRSSADDELVARVRATADGVPLLVEELLATPGVPASVGEAVRTRMAELTDADRSVLYAAAVLGRDFDWELLPAVTGLPLADVTAALERLVATMLVVVDGEGFRFRHALTREAVVALLVPPRRAAIARAALAALDAARRPERELADLALQAGDRARAGELLVASGRASLRRGALGTAVATLRRAVDLLDNGGGTDSRTALVAALALAGRLDEALAVGEELLAALSGAGANRGAGAQATDLAPRLGTGDMSAAAVHLELARAAMAATRRATAVTHLDAAKGMLAARPDPRLAAQAEVLTAEVALDADELDRALAAARAALAMADQATAPDIRCHALELVGRGHRVHDVDAARAAFAEAYRTADAAGLPVWRLRAQHELGTIDLLDHAGTETLLAARETAEQLGVHSTAVVLDIQLVAAYHLRFDLDAAQAHAGRAVALSRRLTLGRTHAMALFFEAATSAMRGDRDETRRGVAAALRAAPDDAEIEGYAWAAPPASWSCCGATGRPRSTPWTAAWPRCTRWRAAARATTAASGRCCTRSRAATVWPPTRWRGYGPPGRP